MGSEAPLRSSLSRLCSLLSELRSSGDASELQCPRSRCLELLGSVRAFDGDLSSASHFSGIRSDVHQNLSSCRSSDDSDILLQAGQADLKISLNEPSLGISLSKLTRLSPYDELVWEDDEEPSNNARIAISGGAVQVAGVQQLPFVASSVQTEATPRDKLTFGMTAPPSAKIRNSYASNLGAQPKSSLPPLPRRPSYQQERNQQRPILLDDDVSEDSDEDVSWKKPQRANKRYKQTRLLADDDVEDVEPRPKSSFLTASEKLAMSSLKKGIDNASARSSKAPSRQHGVHDPAGSKRGVRSGFVSPVRTSQQANGGTLPRQAAPKDPGMNESTLKCLEELQDEDGQLPDVLKNIEPRLIEQICNEIMTQDTKTRWSDIAGLEHAKQCVTEVIIWPLKRPDLFRGTRAPVSGLLLYGPPGTGKTLIGKAIAGETNATFFSISASSLTSKWIGEGEKLVRALFGVASCKEPAVIFIDEIDSLLSQRQSEGEHESSRRLKTQFLIEMEGCGTGDRHVLVIGATNRPQELDEAARRRMPNRLYIPLPNRAARKEIVRNLLQKDDIMALSEADMDAIAEEAEGYSGSDMRHLVREAAMMPLREAALSGRIDKMEKDDIRPVGLQDFRDALQRVNPSVANSELKAYEEWTAKFGSGNLRVQAPT
ncbi:unnamed protein product [Closterium sp. NIES-64]|nr:unnamed protein product [Closterium sp. NIES-64]CAI5970664.1 unnamed protein product [Closterium sp. NIES-65]